MIYIILQAIGLIYLLIVRPFAKRNDTIVEVINEISIVYAIGMMWSFMGSTADEADKNGILLLVGLSVFGISIAILAFVDLIVQIIKFIVNKCKRKNKVEE